MTDFHHVSELLFDRVKKSDYADVPVVDPKSDLFDQPVRLGTDRKLTGRIVSPLGAFKVEGKFYDKCVSVEPLDPDKPFADNGDGAKPVYNEAGLLVGFVVAANVKKTVLLAPAWDLNPG